MERPWTRLLVHWLQLVQAGAVAMASTAPFPPSYALASAVLASPVLPLRLTPSQFDVAHAVCCVLVAVTSALWILHRRQYGARIAAAANWSAVLVLGLAMLPMLRVLCATWVCGYDAKYEYDTVLATDWYGPKRCWTSLHLLQVLLAATATLACVALACLVVALHVSARVRVLALALLAAVSVTLTTEPLQLPLALLASNAMLVVAGTCLYNTNQHVLAHWTCVGIAAAALWQHVMALLAVLQVTVPLAAFLAVLLTLLLLPAATAGVQQWIGKRKRSGAGENAALHL